VGKLPENAGKNGGKRTLILKKWLPTWSESHENLFSFRGHSTNGRHEKVLVYSHKKWPKNYF